MNEWEILRRILLYKGWTLWYNEIVSIADEGDFVCPPRIFKP
jgi:hypothetical protein